MAKRRYRSKGGWVMGSFWQDGREGELHEEQAEAYATILEPLDDNGRPLAPPAPADAAPTPLADIPAPARVIAPPQKAKKRPGMSASTGVNKNVADTLLNSSVERK